MNLYRVWCKFEPDHINPLTGRRGQWRVFESMYISYQTAPDVLHTSTYLSHVSIKQFNIGSIIRPHKELNRVLKMRHDSR